MDSLMLEIRKKNFPQNESTLKFQVAKNNGNNS